MQSKWLMLLVSLLMVETVGMPLIIPSEAAEEKKDTKKAVTEQKSCSACHDDFTDVLSEKHPPVKGNVLTTCMKCHAPEGRGMTESKKFDASIHRTHLTSPIKVDCLDCHTFQPGRSFGLTGATVSYGAPSEEDMVLIKEIFTSAVESNFLDAVHFSANITCVSCHGIDILGENTLENTRCLSCHGPLEELIAKTAPKNFPDRNPHNSHLGEIGCTICHAGHAESKIYCLECHPKFEMILP